MVFGKIGKYVFRGGVLPGFGFLGLVYQFHFVKKNFSQLLWGANIELFPGVFVNFCFEVLNIVVQIFGQRI